MQNADIFPKKTFAALTQTWVRARVCVAAKRVIPPIHPPSVATSRERHAADALSYITLGKRLYTQNLMSDKRNIN